GVPPVNTFAGARIDRGGSRRTDPDWLRERIVEPGSRAVLVGDGRVYVDGSSRPLLVPVRELDPALLDEPVLLGVGQERALLAVAFDGSMDGGEPMELREAGARMSQEDG